LQTYKLSTRLPKKEIYKRINHYPKAIEHLTHYVNFLSDFDWDEFNEAERRRFKEATLFLLHLGRMD
jgi:hypothetical protein